LKRLRKNRRQTPTLEDAISVAVRAHRGQVDKAGDPYILHPFRVMFRLRTVDERIVAMLHDVVEESDINLGRLRRMGYPEKVIDALDCLTWRKRKESYEQYVERVRSNPLATSVKIADLQDHLTSSINGNPGFLQKNYPQLYERYQKALSKLGRWRLLGLDAFDPDAEMCLLGEYETETAALEAAYKRLEELEQTQPSSSSGGQAPRGIQDRVYIEDPQGNVKRILPRA